METIIPNQRFKHGTETFEEGQSYEVAPELAFYFKMSGWVGERAGAPSEQALDIQAGQLGHSSEVN